MRYIVFAFFLIFFSNCFAGKVIFILGTSCSGKTSLCNELLNQSDEWRLVSEDNIFVEQIILQWKSNFPNEFKDVEEAIDQKNIFHAIGRNQLLFIERVANEKRIIAKSAINSLQKKLNIFYKEQEKEKDNPNSWGNLVRKQITQTIIDLAKTNHVIVDSWFLKEKHIDQISKLYDVIRVVAYCPFLDIIKRTLKRNYDSLLNGKNISNLRFFNQALNHFTEYYDLSSTENGSIDTLEKEAVIHGCDIVNLCFGDSNNASRETKAFYQKEFSSNELAKYQKNLINKFKSERSYLIPKFKFDLVIRTDLKSYAINAAYLIGIINSKN